MATSEPGEFRVTDRRRRGDAGAEAEPVEPGTAAGPVRSEAPAAGPSRADRPSPAADAPRPAADREEGEPVTGDRTLVGLFVALASSAVVALGEVADPDTGARHHDLPQAAATIDLLVILREKTEGHRTPEESQTLDDLIYDLQLRYVAAAGG